MFRWDALDPRFTTILCDIWGVVHDGVALHDHAVERLRGWRGEGRTVILVTNAPRTADAVAAQLDRLQLPRDCWDGISTSGEAGVAALLRLPDAPGFLGTPADRANLEARGLAFADDDYAHVAVTGLDGLRMQVEDYCIELDAWHEQGVVFHCLNPDRVVHRGGMPEPCAGAIADAYEAMGGDVVWYGKPFAAIYRHALGLADNPAPSTVLAVGDSLKTDMVGAALQGFGAVFVAGGIHRGEPFPADFADAHGVGDWHPLGIVDGLV